MKYKYKIIHEDGHFIGKYKTLEKAQNKLLTDIFCYWHITQYF